jgi:hypothetical protein
MSPVRVGDGDAGLPLVEDASHWSQWDQPELAAQLIKQATSRTRKPPEEPGGIRTTRDSSTSVW